jgi:hypothetical protein
MDERAKLKALLDDYYGNTRDDSHKEEIIDFIESNIWGIAGIFHDEGDLS